MKGDILINYFLKETENDIFIRYSHILTIFGSQEFPILLGGWDELHQNMCS